MVRARHPSWTWLVVAATLLPAGCPSGDDTAGAGGGGKASASHASSASASSASSSAASTGAGGSGGCDSVPQYPGPPGWVGYTDWQCNGCRLYLPGSKDVLPSPIVWEKCPTSPGGITCQSMKIDWTGAADPVGDAILSTVGGAPTLAFTRNGLDTKSPYLIEMIADVDGPTLSALYAVRASKFASDGCISTITALNENKYLYKVLGDDAYGKWGSSPHNGIVGGVVGELHPTMLLDDSPDEDSWACGANWIYRVQPDFTLSAYGWDMKKETFISSSATDPEGLQFGQLAASEDSLFWTSDNLYITGINSWNPVDGARPFVRFIGDATRGAGNLGTDGKDLVWSYGEGKKPGDEVIKFPLRSIMTAPFTTDPSKLAPKRLRSDPSYSMGFLQFQVGCGRAAHGAGGSQPIVVVRLSDGVSWLIPQDSPPDFVPGSVIGLTCEHIYLWGKFGGRYNIARIALDSLGPGMAPD